MNDTSRMSDSRKENGHTGGIILICGGRLAGLIYSIFRERHAFIGYVDDVYPCAYVESTYGMKKLGTSADLASLASPGASAVVAVTDVQARGKYGRMLQDAGIPLATLIADTAIVSEHASIAQGCIIRHHAVISAQVRLGENTVISDNSYVGHDSVVGRNVYIAPGVNLNGSVTIGDDTFVGTGAVVLPEITVGRNCTIGAAACVHKNLPDGSTVAGVPAKPLSVKGRPPLVSVTMAACNHEKYVSQTIRSILGQSFTDFEFIIIDDGSSDGTPREIAAFEDRRIRAEFSRHNSGIIVTKNRCLDLAQGKYVAIVNSDDAYLPDKLEKQVAYLESHPECGVVLTDAAIIDEDGNPFLDKTHFYYSIFTQPNRSRYEWLRYFFYVGNCLCMPSALIRRECYEKIGRPDSRLMQLPDLDLWVRMCMAYDMHIIPEKLTLFRVRDNQANASGHTPDKIRRGAWEYGKVLRRYLAIRDENVLLRIFPEAERYTGRYHLSGDLVPYVISRLALDADTPTLKSFALDVLFDLLENPDQARRIHERFGFGYKEFIALTGSGEECPPVPPSRRRPLVDLFSQVFRR
jgi:sugar O-acyltransferase (sialic acid O-acetyltransferase NeuD family)